jgi:hypothetical protein
MNKLRQQLKELLARFALQRDRATEAWSRLSDRDRKLGTGLGIGVSVVLTVLVVYLATGHVAKLKSDITVRAKQLEDVREMRTDFRASKDKLDAINQKLKANSLPPKSFLEEKARETRVEIQSMEDRAAPPNDLFKAQIVEVKIKKVTLANVARFLHKIESSGAGMSVKSLELVPNHQDPKYLDGKLHVLSLKPKES